jgi:UDP-2,3-diacylglucosamine pyrophosphatase LpxH
MSGPAAAGVIRDRLPDDTLLAFISDTHIGGAAGSDIFESAAELTALLQDLHRHQGPVELVLAGDFFDLLRMGDAGDGGDRVAETLTRPAYQELFAALRTFARAPGHRVVYLVGNHDAEAWWNPQVQRALGQAGLVDAFALSYSASFESLPGQLIYCEHGNQFDPTNAIADYANPLDTPVGAHVVTELVRPIGSGAAVTHRLDLRDVSYVFPLAALPQWIAGRIFYQFLAEVLRWVLAPLVVAYLAYEGLAAVVEAFEETLGLRKLFLELGYNISVVVIGFAVLFFISRRTANHAISILTSRFTGVLPGGRTVREDVAIRQLLEDDRPPPLAGDLSGGEIAVFVSGHTHAPALSELVRADGRKTVVVNTGCWLRQLQPVDARLDAPTVFVPVFVHSHVRVRSTRDGVTVELWDHPKPAERRLPWIERVAIAGRMPPQPPAGSGPRLVAQQLVARRAPAVEGDPR